MAIDSGLRSDVIAKLLAAMKANTLPVTTKRLGQIGREHCTKRLLEFGCIPESITYKVVKRIDDGVAFVLESAFGYLGGDASGVRFMPERTGPPESRTHSGRSAPPAKDWRPCSDSSGRAGRSRSHFVMHLRIHGVEYQDRGKSSITVRE